MDESKSVAREQDCGQGGAHAFEFGALVNRYGTQRLIALGTVALVASRSVPAASAFDKARGFISEHVIALGAAACVILIALIFLGWCVSRVSKRKGVSQ